MKRVLSLLLSCVLLLGGCSSKPATNNRDDINSENADYSDVENAISSNESGHSTEPLYERTENQYETISEQETNDYDTKDIQTQEVEMEPLQESTSIPLQEDNNAVSLNSSDPTVSYTGLNDPKLLSFIEKTVYNDIKGILGNDYVVENVSTVYISKEYIEELTYNSQSNIYYGYSLTDLDAQFQGTRYVFTLDDNGETTVIPFEEYDDTYEQVLKNIAIGTGVILVCVTVSVASGGLGLPAVSMVFAASAQSATIFAASSGVISAVIHGIITGVQTGDVQEAIHAGALAGSESFMWGAISGAVLGGATELITLHSAASGGLSLNQAAMIMRESNLPANFVKQIHSIDEYYELLELAEKGGLTINDLCSVCMNTGYPLEIVKLFHSTKEGGIYFEQAGLYSETINGQAVLIRTIDLTYESELAGHTVTNLERMQQGYAAIDPLTGQAYQLHHIGQSVDSPLAILTQWEHTGGGNNAILHDLSIADGQGVHSLLSDAEWALQREEFWESLAAFLIG